MSKKWNIDEAAGEYLASKRRAMPRDTRLSQTDVGEKIGVTYQQIQKYEAGTDRMRVETFVRFCEVIGVDPAKALGEVLAARPKR